MPSADPFVAAGLLAAMAAGEPLEVDSSLSVSPALLQGVEQLQEIFSTWVPELRKISVTARPAPPRPGRPETAAFFSGGTDSLHTFLEKEAEVSHLIHIRGFDYRRENATLVEQIDDRNREFLERRGRDLLVVESNLRDLYDARRVHVFLYHGCHLASVALALGFARVYVPASFGWATLVPWGTHPVTDPLWGTETVHILHHGSTASRIDKLRRIGQNPAALEVLRVCSGNVVYNCGACEKCLRTRVGLRLLGLAAPTLPRLHSVRPLYGLRIESDRARSNWRENISAAVATGDLAVARAIRLCLVREDARRAAIGLDDALLGGRLRCLLRRLKRLARAGRLDRPEIRIDSPD